jgi:predicted nucleotide-binding protein (sugar kinase/HSP70/actin superfamily)
MDNIIARDNEIDSLINDLGLGDDAVQGFDPNASVPGRTGDQYQEVIRTNFTASDKDSTTILVAGLTVAHDTFLTAALRGLDYNIVPMEVPTYDSLRVGKEFGNRGQCNPTYFTVGNLVKYLIYLRDEEGIETEDILNNYIFFTAGACGPCRFGTYVTEYRKALRDAGFEGFRVLTGSQMDGLEQDIGEGGGFDITPKFIFTLVQSLVIGDILNAMMYRIRPYEVNKGDTDKALDQCKEIMVNAFEKRSSIVRAVWKCRKLLAAVKVDRSQVKPRVAIIGEFWAMTTEGDGNYQMQRFLEQEGAEVDVQLITAWILYITWQKRWDTKNRAALDAQDGGGRGIEGVSIKGRNAMLWGCETALMAGFQFYAKIMGLRDYHFCDMDKLADISHKFYNNELRGGEGHMEVGKLIMNVLDNKVNMTLSVKPFGCMPSSGVSDGVQSSITELYPQAIFLPIETTGDGAVNAYSRVQMQLFKAKQAAQKELDEALEKCGITYEAFKAKLDKSSKHKDSLHRSPHKAGCTAADLAYEVVGK